jgi:hypothetical protein
MQDFSRALVDCRLGKKISREGWNAGGQFVVFPARLPERHRHQRQHGGRDGHP